MILPTGEQAKLDQYGSEPTDEVGWVIEVV